MNGFRRAEDRLVHDCIQKDSINEIRHSVSEIKSCVERLTKTMETGIGGLTERQKKVLELIFGKDMDGGLVTKIQLMDQSDTRLWWAMAIIGTAVMAGMVKVFFL